MYGTQTANQRAKLKATQKLIRPLSDTIRCYACIWQQDVTVISNTSTKFYIPAQIGRKCIIVFEIKPSCHNIGTKVRETWILALRYALVVTGYEW